MSKISDFIKLLLKADVMSNMTEKNGLTKLETGLFDSIEFCLGILGTVPVPIFLINKNDEVVLLNSPKFDGFDRKSFSCSHCAQPEEDDSVWTLHAPGGCIFCESIVAARKEQRKIVKKGVWKVIAEDRTEKEFIVLVHAAPVKIENEDFVFAAIENLTEVEQLKGLLPICMECNKIYDDKADNWIRIDEYITDRSPAKFSHGLCPHCSDILMDNLEKELK